MARTLTRSIPHCIRNGAAQRAFGELFDAWVGLPFIFVCVLAVSCNGADRTQAQRHTYQAVQQQQVQQGTGQGSRQRSGQWRRSREIRDGAARTRGSPQTIRGNIGFRSRNQLDEHFAKHGAEFGQVTEKEYLRQAQMLRDEPAGGTVEEIRRPDGTVSRYDRTSGAFIAFNPDGTIRTFFKPNNGEAYFRRQATRGH